MKQLHAVEAELCPACGSLDVRVVEPRWFAVEVGRRDEIEASGESGRCPRGGETDDASEIRVEFGCRDCGLTWR